jgi:hypothetical protein
MQRNAPAPVRPLEGGDRGVALEDDFGQDIDGLFGRLFVCEGKARTVGG